MPYQQKYWQLALNNRIAQYSKPINLDLHDIPTLQKHRWLPRHSHPRRCAGKDHVAWLQRAYLRDVGDDLGRAEDHLLRVAVLHRLAVETQTDAKILRIAHLIFHHQRWPDRRERVECLSRHPLLAILPELPIA